MAYMLLIIEPRGQRGERSDAQARDACAQMGRFGAGLAARGLLRAGECPAAQWATVEVREIAPGCAD